MVRPQVGAVLQSPLRRSESHVQKGQTMKRILSLSLLVLAMTFTTFAQTTNLSGKWTVEWLTPNRTSYSPRSTNPITLVSGSNGVLGGSYVNDENEVCNIDGTVSVGSTTFTVQCPTWKIVFVGMISNNGLTLDGSYTVPPGGKYTKGPSGYFSAEKC